MPDSIFEGTVIRKAFATDPAKENGGIWREHESGICVRIRRSSRNEHKRALRKFYKPFAHLQNVDPKDEQLVKMKAGAEQLVADWGVRAEVPEGETPDKLDPVGAKDLGQVRPLTGATGDEIKPTEENVLKAFIEQPDFFAWVSEEADTFEHYRIAAVESAGGNSSRTSGGSGNGETLQPPPS